MGKIYSEELSNIPSTYEWVKNQKVDSLTRFLERWAGNYSIVVGSGGSYTAAVIVSLLREWVQHSPTKPASTLEFLSLAERIPSTRALLLSAEGKNSDILAAARKAISSDLFTAALTLTTHNPLVELADTSHAIRVFSYAMPWGKDGYLATNTLVAISLLFSKALLPQSLESLEQYFSINHFRAHRALLQQHVVLHEAVEQGVLIIHGIDATPFAVALESNLSEAAIAVTEVVDLRQFAHGRHLQLSVRSRKPLVIFAFSPAERRLAHATLKELPNDIRAFPLELRGQNRVEYAITGLLDALLITEVMATRLAYDPGSPSVPLFSRNIHRLDTAALMELDNDLPTQTDLAARRKLAHIRTEGSLEYVESAAHSFLEKLASARIEALVCDFDGTLCRAENRYDGIDSRIVARLIDLIGEGLVVAVATGRGRSLQKNLLSVIPVNLQSRILIGYYSGATLHPLNETVTKPTPLPYANDILRWLRGTAFKDRASDEDEIVKGGQLTFRVNSSNEALRLHAALQARLSVDRQFGWRVFCSGHTVDVLDSRTTKSNVISHIARVHGLNPDTQILRIGDSGAELGNDFELLGTGLALSSDTVSISLETCWNFARWGCNQAEATLHYLNTLEKQNGAFRIRL